MHDPQAMELITRYLDGSITAAEFDTLNAQLAGDAALRRHFIGLTYTARLMAENLNPQFATNQQPAVTDARVESIHSQRLHMWRWVAAAALIAIAATAWFTLPHPMSNTRPDSATPISTVATLTQTRGAVWSSAPLHTGQDLNAGAIAIESGEAEFLLNSGNFA